jgi:transposase-like protein
MGTGRRRHSSTFKAKMALEAIKGEKTLDELASEFGIHPVQIAHWKKHALEGLPGVFDNAENRWEQADQALIAQLYQEIGQLQIEQDWLRKKGLMPIRRDAE